MKLYLILSYFLVSEIVSTAAFSKKNLGCVDGSSNDNSCPKKYEFEGGPGYIGHRLDWPVTMFCSPSCNDNSNPKECSLILALHGIYSNPGDQMWLMLGAANDATIDTFNEDEYVGGPYCISFHKAKDDAWEYKCGGDDEAHLEGFIQYALDNFPIDPDAVNLHGFSSGAIQTNHMMNTRCSIEKYISAAAPYGAGWVNSPPTTKAAYLVAHGTLDEIVPYADNWNFDTNKNFPSCECIKIATEGCSNRDTVYLQGERLAGSIAALRGYTDFAWDAESPTPSSKLDLITEDVAKCHQSLSECFSVVESPNPWTEGLSCDNIPSMETDVIEYPISSDSNAGPVIMWRMNMHNHDYPNKRRNGWAGPAEFFIQLRIFFNDNRGRQIYPGTRTITQVGTGYACTNPHWGAISKPWTINANAIYEDVSMSKDDCKEMCFNEKACVEAYYLDLSSYGTHLCILHNFLQPCESLENISWTDAVHWVANTIEGPTPSPTKMPTQSPTQSHSPSNSNSPSNPPTSYNSFCSSSETLNSDLQVSYSCFVNFQSIGDFLDGSTTSDSCANEDGAWIPYTCQTALDYWIGLSDVSLKKYFKDEWWQPRCCLGDEENEESFCSIDETLQGGLQVSYSCFVNGQSIGDFLDGSTTSESCANDGGEWIPYTCQTALDYWTGLSDDDLKDYFKDEWWQPRCCLDPTASPTTLPITSLTSTPTSSPTTSPTTLPSSAPTSAPISSPTSSPTTSPTISPTTLPTSSPISSPTSMGGFLGRLKPGDYITSPNGKYELIFRTNGNLVLYDDNRKALWKTKTAGITPFAAVMQNDGNLVVRDSDKKAVFATHTGGNPGARLFVQDDGNLVIRDNSGTPIWDRIQGIRNGIFQGRLNPGDYIDSSDEKYRLYFQGDGNLVLFDQHLNALWSTNTYGIIPWAVGMQPDGNLVLYDIDRKPAFATHTSGNPDARLNVQTDGNLVIYDSSWVPIWDRFNGKL